MKTAVRTSYSALAYAAPSGKAYFKALKNGDITFITYNYR